MKPLDMGPFPPDRGPAPPNKAENEKRSEWVYMGLDRRKSQWFDTPDIRGS